MDAARTTIHDLILSGGSAGGPAVVPSSLVGAHQLATLAVASMFAVAGLMALSWCDLDGMATMAP